MKQGKLVTWGVIAFIAFILLLTVSQSTFLTLEAQERGVLFKQFGGGLIKDKIYQPGFHIVAPWNKMFRYDIREKQFDEEMEVLSSNGLNIKVDVTIRVNPDYSKIGFLHEKFGENYINSLVRPETRSSVRQIIGQFEPEELYSSRRDEVQQLIQKDLEEALGGNYIVLRASLIRDIELPEKVRTAIEEKIQAEQLAFKYTYIIDQERKEAERMIIEAEAKARANEIISASLTDRILQDKGIDATVKLANSPNTKVIVVGSGDSGLPLILGNQ